MGLNQMVEEFLIQRGAIKVGVATPETLAGGPPSVDLDYRMPGARSAVSFALPMDKDAIGLFLAKKDRYPHENDNLATNLRSGDLSWELAQMLNNEGHQSKGTAANMKYRTEVEGWQMTLPPDISHRYIAARSGMGSFGWSGSVGIKDHGTAIILGTTVTAAELEPTEPETEEEQFCDDCKFCVSACAMGMFERDKEQAVTIGGVTFTHSARRNTLLCQFCCGGFTGLHESGKWSTWSPGRFKVPDHQNQQEFIQALMRASQLYRKRPQMPGGYEHIAMKGAKEYMTCGNCQIICFGNKKETAKNLKTLRNSGCVIQNKDGSLFALPPEEAEQAFNNLDQEHKALYF